MDYGGLATCHQIELGAWQLFSSLHVHRHSAMFAGKSRGSKRCGGYISQLCRRSSALGPECCYPDFIRVPARQSRLQTLLRFSSIFTVIIIRTQQQLRKHADLTLVNVAGAEIAVSDSTSILGVTIDKNLTFDDHATFMCKNLYYHIWALHHIRSMLTEDTEKNLAYSLVNARFDYANSLLFGVTSKNILKLQMVQNTLVLVIIGLQRRDHITPTLKQLH